MVFCWSSLEPNQWKLLMENLITSSQQLLSFRDGLRTSAHLRPKELRKISHVRATCPDLHQKPYSFSKISWTQKHYPPFWCFHETHVCVLESLSTCTFVFYESLIIWLPVWTAMDLRNSPWPDRVAQWRWRLGRPNFHPFCDDLWWKNNWSKDRITPHVNFFP